MQSHYEICVSLNGEHLFATHERSCIYVNKARRVYEEIVKRFPESEGFKTTVTHWESAGRKVTF